MSSNVTFNLTSAADNYTLSSSVAGQLTLTSNNATFENTTFNTPSGGGSLTINSGDGNDTALIAQSAITELTRTTAPANVFTGTLNVNGEGGNDAFTITENTAGTNGLNLSIDGGTGNNTLAASDNTLSINNPSGTAHSVHLSNVSMTQSGTNQLITVAGSSLTLFLSGDTLTSTAAGMRSADLIHVNGPEPIVNLSSNNTFVLNQSPTANVFFVGNSVSPPLTSINVEASGNNYSVATNENAQRVFGLVLDNRTITSITHTNPSSSVSFSNSGSTVGRITYSPPPNASGNAIDTLTVTLSGGARSISWSTYWRSIRRRSFRLPLLIRPTKILP